MIEKRISDPGTTATRVGHRENGGIYLQQGRSWVSLSTVEVQRLREFLDQPTYEAISPAKWVSQ